MRATGGRVCVRAGDAWGGKEGACVPFVPESYPRVHQEEQLDAGALLQAGKYSFLTTETGGGDRPRAERAYAQIAKSVTKFAYLR
eukprot:7938533-Pyramimonas_sp.AAC.1